jgi:hypothetical protein
MGKMRNAHRSVIGKQREETSLEDLGVDGEVI